jgi:hypothetical protein
MTTKERRVIQEAKKIISKLESESYWMKPQFLPLHDAVWALKMSKYPYSRKRRKSKPCKNA